MKRVYITGHGPLQNWPDVEVGWEDVWLRLYKRRTSLRLAPCLMSRESILHDIDVRQRMVDDPKLGNFDDSCLKGRIENWSAEEIADMRESCRQDVIDMKGILHSIDTSSTGVFVGNGDSNGSSAHRFALANIYTHRDTINRVEAERMLDIYLNEIGVKNAVFKWKYSKFIAWPS